MPLMRVAALIRAIHRTEVVTYAVAADKAQRRERITCPARHDTAGPVSQPSPAYNLPALLMGTTAL